MLPPAVTSWNEAIERIGGDWGPKVSMALCRFMARRQLPRFVWAMELFGVMRQEAWRAAPWIEIRDRYHGHRMRLDLSDFYQRLAAFMGCYHEVHVMEVVRRAVRPGDAMVDGGANTGLLSCHAAGWLGASGTEARGRIDAFEPNPLSGDQCAWHFERNGLTGVRPHRAGLADAEGEATVCLPDPKNSGSATLWGAPERLAADAVDVATTPVRALDHVLEREGVAGDDRPLFIKLDIEGSELAALRGASATIERRRPAVLAEVNPEMLARAGTTPEEVHAWMRERGYRAYAFRRGWARRLYRLDLHEMPAGDERRERDVLWLAPGGPHAERLEPFMRPGRAPGEGAPEAGQGDDGADSAEPERRAASLPA